MKVFPYRESQGFYTFVLELAGEKGTFFIVTLKIHFTAMALWLSLCSQKNTLIQSLCGLTTYFILTFSSRLIHAIICQEIVILI